MLMKESEGQRNNEDIFAYLKLYFKEVTLVACF